MTRIDVPARGARFRPARSASPASPTPAIAASTRRVLADDGGDMDTAELFEPPLSPDVWVRWEGTFTPRPARDHPDGARD